MGRLFMRILNTYKNNRNARFFNNKYFADKNRLWKNR